MTKDLKEFKKKMRQAIADYMTSEGCSCCRNVEDHKSHAEVIAKLLNVKSYPDNSGYDFYKHRTLKNKNVF